MGNEPVKEMKYRLLLNMLERLRRLDPAIKDDEVQAVIESHMAGNQPIDRVPKQYEVDDWGRTLGVGKRKTATARAYLVEGEGGSPGQWEKPDADVWTTSRSRECHVALKATDRLDKYNVFAIVKGGGVTGQTEALTLAVAKL